MTKNKEPKHVMLDLETLGNDYSGVFVTLGACKFDPWTGEVDTKDTFYERIDWQSSLDEGRTVTPATIKWWMQQSKAARVEIMGEGLPMELPLRSVLILFEQWLPKGVTMWGNGPNFDLGKLEHAYGFYDIPWVFHKLRDVRTVRDLAKGLVDKKDTPFVGTPHHALHDAIHQATYVSAMYKALRPDVK